jgi:hypothetical protein
MATSLTKIGLEENLTTYTIFDDPFKSRWIVSLRERSKGKKLLLQKPWQTRK